METSISDDDWHGWAFADDARGGKDLRTRLHLQGLIPEGHVVARVLITFQSEMEGGKQLPTVPFLEVMLFDATGCDDPIAAFNEAKASGKLDLKVVAVAPTKAELLDLFRGFVVDLSPRGWDVESENWIVD